MELTTKGAKLSHDVTGESGPWLTLVHGAGDNQRCWFPQLPAFSQRHRVLTWDLRGHGSTVVTDEDYSRAAQTRDAVELWEQLGVDQGALMGYSMGGGLALELAATYPERVNALILANSGLPRRRETTEEQRRQMEERRRADIERLEKEGMAGLWPNRIISVFSPDFPAREPDVVERYREVFVQTNAEEHARNQREGLVARPQAELDLGAIQCPVLVIGGIHETQWRDPATSEALRAALPQAQVHIFPTGHFAAMEVPEQFNALVLDFLARAGV